MDNGPRRDMVRWLSPRAERPESSTASTQGHSAGSDVEFVLAQTADWIRNADTKTGLLLAALTVLLAAISSQAHRLRHLWAGHGRIGWVLMALAASVVLLGMAFALLVAVLIPRTKTPITRYSWPWIASVPLTELERLSADSARSEAWMQAKTMSEIALHKYRYF